MTFRSRVRTSQPSKPGLFAAVRSRRGAFLPILAVTELSICLSILAALAVLVAFIPGSGDGAALAASSACDHPIRRLVSVGCGKRIAVLCDDACSIQDLDGARAATVWVRCGEQRVTAIAGSPVAPRLALGRSDGVVAVIDSDTLETIWDCSKTKSTVSSTTFSPDGRTMAIGTGHGEVFLVDAETGQPRHRFTVKDDVRAVCFSTDGKRFFVPTGSGAVSIRDVATGEETTQLPFGSEHGVTALGLSPDGNKLVVGNSYGEISLLDVADRRRIAVHQRFLLPILAAAFTPDGARIVTGSVEREIGVYAASDLTPLRTLAGHGRGTRSLTMAGGTLVSSGHDGRAVAWNLSSGAGTEVPIR